MPHDDVANVLAGVQLATPTVAFYRILPGKSADEGRQLLGGYQGTVVVDGYAVYEVLARDGPGFALAHCRAHTKRKYEAVAEHWPMACAEIDQLIQTSPSFRLGQ